MVTGNALFYTVGLAVRNFLMGLFGVYAFIFLIHAAMFGAGCAAGFGIYIAVFAAVKILGRFSDSLPDALRDLGELSAAPFDPWEALAAVAILFGICALRIRFAVKKEMDRSITENIREL